MASLTGPQVQAAAARKRRAEFAEIVATGVTLRAAGEQMGLRQSRSGQLWKGVRDEFAELVSEGESVLYASIVLGLSARAGKYVWAAICTGLGEDVDTPGLEPGTY